MKAIGQENFANHSWNVNSVIAQQKVETEKETPKIDNETKLKSKNKDSLSLGYRDSTKPIGGRNVGVISIRLFDSSVVDPNKQQPKETVLFNVNGILNDKESAEKTKNIIEDIAGKKVNLIHNETKFGGLHDALIEVPAQLLTDSSVNKIDRKVEDQIYDVLKSGKAVKIVAHSQGAAITANALNAIKDRLLEDTKNVSQTLRLMANVEVLTIGGAANRNDFPDEVKVTEIKNSSDPVPVIGQNIFSSNIDDRKFALNVVKKAMSDKPSSTYVKAVASLAVSGLSLATKVDRAFVGISTTIGIPMLGLLKYSGGKNIINEHSADTGYLQKDAVKQAIKEFTAN